MEVNMTGDVVAGFVRHILTFGGGLMVTKGMIDEATMTAIVGGIVTIVGAAWSWWAKKKAA